MPDAVAEQLAYQQRRVIPARMPRAEHTPAVNARATRARSARPATVTLSRTAALATSAPAFPARPASPGTIPGPPLGTREYTLHSPARVKPGNTRRRGPSVAVRGKPTVIPTVRPAPRRPCWCSATATSPPSSTAP
jgi:hypothetical protein